MKKGLVLVAILFLISSLAWAEGTAGGAATPEAVNPADSTAVAGGCTLPDFTGLSPDQRVAAALAAGLQVSGAVNKQTAMCPTVFHCDSITNCGIGLCSPPQDIGQCCNAGGGSILCCLNGTFKVQRCHCRCTANPCDLQCGTSTNVTLQCS